MKKFYFFIVALVLGVMSASAADYYLVGGFNGWTNGSSTYKFTDAGNGEYTLDVTGDLTSAFKITDGTWNDSGTYGGNGAALVLGETYTLTQPGSDIMLDCSVVTNPHLVFNPTAKTLVITGSQGSIEKSFCLHGTLPGGSSSWADMALENVEGTNTWVVENLEVTAQSQFGIKELTNGAQSGWVSASSSNVISGPGTFACKYNGTNFTITPGTYTLKFDGDAMNLVVSGAGTEIEVTYYLIGDFNEWTLVDEACKFTQSTENEEEYVLDYEGTLTTTDGFKVNDGTWTNNDINFGGNGANLELGVAYAYGVGVNDNIYVAVDVLNPHIILNPKAGTITMTGESSVEGIEIEENVAPVYYNLQGVRVDAPANGLYIVVRGNKVAKELVK